MKKINVNKISNKEWYASLWRIRLLGLVLLFFMPFFFALDIILIFNNYFLFKLVNIQSLKRNDYIDIQTRMRMPKSLVYKLSCAYCSYANGLAYMMKDTAKKYHSIYF